MPIRCGSVVLALALLVRCPVAFAADYRTIDVPGALSTAPRRINTQGDIVGAFTDTDYRSHGFLLKGKTLIRVDAPDARDTVLNGINGRGDIVGTFLGSQLVGRSFLLRDGAFLPVEPPNAYNLQTLTINNRGEVAGIYLVTPSGGPDRAHGFVLRGDQLSDIAIAGASHGSAVYGINDAGHVVGSYGDGLQHHGFLLRGGKLLTIDAPGARVTNAMDINSRGDILGMWYDGNNWHGFVVGSEAVIRADGSGIDRARFAAIDYPNAVDTMPFGINDRGDIVGGVRFATGPWRGFVLSK